MRALAAASALLATLAIAAPARAADPIATPAPDSGVCVDPIVKKRLLESKRGRRSDERDFVTAARHELTVQGGYYVSDLLDGTFIVGAAYTYHLTDDAGIEASFGYSQVRSSVAARLEKDKGVTVLPKEDRVYLVFTDLIWSPVHGKMRVFADSIVHFDIYGAVGVGVIDNATSFGAAGQFGLGMKVLFGRSWAVRLDVRDHLYRQQVLTVNQYVQDFSLTLGASVFLPMGL
ncbi:MAG TPA: outer membrane beta-barrel domain-containing protein [Polyangia bacterium]|nr:outer membrane beta-barrel domain-containing protein [Polyangia bacterium]